MKKILLVLLISISFVIETFATNEIEIISREQWWANENYRYLDWKEWKEILKNRKEKASNQNKIYTKEQKQKIKEYAQKEKTKNNIMLNEFWEYIELRDKIKYENTRKLAWPISKAKKINSIIIHHTHLDYESSVEWVRRIYKYHALTRQWWDIWYNYLIGKNGEIFEWRAGWDYAVWAHDKRNNIWSIWIAMIWDYSENDINKKQYTALRKLTKYLVNKYKIDIWKKTYFHEECNLDKCEKLLKSELKYPIIWHRDAWHTTCPWDKLYAEITKLRKDILYDKLIKIYKQRIFKPLSKYSDREIIDLLAKLEVSLEEKQDKVKTNLKWLIIEYFKYKKSEIYNHYISQDKEDKIKIKLSYPDNDEITIKSWWVKLPLKRKWNHIYIKWQKYNIFKVPKKVQNSILEISSWERIPAWDKEKRYNDNRFRWDIYVYAQNWKLVVVNELSMQDYLKGLWEVSNWEDPEKIKAIVVAARSYATWYTKKARKFKWEFYDWSDDPNVFQRYLWYSLEKRSPKINKIVDETKWQVISYNWELIKPWYFSRSSGKTMSFFEYCSIRYSEKICKTESKKYPYLQSVVDTGSKWQKKAWHGVGISWAWVSYFAKKWWTYDMIIKYFLKWVDIKWI